MNNIVYIVTIVIVAFLTFLLTKHFYKTKRFSLLVIPSLEVEEYAKNKISKILAKKDPVWNNSLTDSKLKAYFVMRTLREKGICAFIKENNVDIVHVPIYKAYNIPYDGTEVLISFKYDEKSGSLDLPSVQYVLA